MTVVSKLAALAVAGVLAASLAGCGNAQTAQDGTLTGDASNAGGWVQLPGGRRVMCVAFGSGGISCDWAGQK